MRTLLVTSIDGITVDAFETITKVYRNVVSSSRQSQKGKKSLNLVEEVIVVLSAVLNC